MPQVVLAGGFSRGFTSLLDRGKQQADQRADERDADEDLGEGEGGA